MCAVFVADGPSGSIQFYFDEIITVSCNLELFKWTGKVNLA